MFEIIFNATQQEKIIKVQLKKQRKTNYYDCRMSKKLSKQGYKL